MSIRVVRGRRVWCGGCSSVIFARTLITCSLFAHLLTFCSAAHFSQLLTFRANGHSVSDGKVLHSARRCKSASTSKGHSQCKTGPIWVHWLIAGRRPISVQCLFSLGGDHLISNAPPSKRFSSVQHICHAESEVGELEQIGFNCIALHFHCASTMGGVSCTSNNFMTIHIMALDFWEH